MYRPSIISVLFICVSSCQLRQCATYILFRVNICIEKVAVGSAIRVYRHTSFDMLSVDSLKLLSLMVVTTILTWFITNMEILIAVNNSLEILKMKTRTKISFCPPVTSILLQNFCCTRGN